MITSFNMVGFGDLKEKKISKDGQQKITTSFPETLSPNYCI